MDNRPGSLETLRKALRTLQSDSQERCLQLMKQDITQLRRFEKHTSQRLNDIARQLDTLSHDDAVDLGQHHQNLLIEFRKQLTRDRYRQPRWSPEGWPPSFIPEAFPGDEGSLPEVPSRSACYLRQIEVLDTSANHGHEIHQFPADAQEITTNAEYDAEPGLNQTKFNVEVVAGGTPTTYSVHFNSGYRFNFSPPSNGVYLIRPVVFMNGSWRLWTNGPGIRPNNGSLLLRLRVQVSQFESDASYATVEHNVLDEAALGTNIEGSLVYNSFSFPEALELSVELVKDLRAHIVVQCITVARIANSGLARVNFWDRKFFVRVPEVHVDEVVCDEQSLMDTVLGQPRLSLTPRTVSLRPEEQTQLAIEARPPQDGEVTLFSSNSDNASVVSPATLTGGRGLVDIMGGNAGTQARITARMGNYERAFADVHVENSLGSWESGPEIVGLVAIHMALLRTGKVLMFSADHSRPDNLAAIDLGKSALWNPRSNEVQEIELKRNLFCAGHCSLADGRLLVVGGQNRQQLPPEDPLLYIPILSLVGADKDVHTFDPISETWTRHSDMPEKRWYPTCAALPDGRAIIVGGATFYVGIIPLLQFYNRRKELFDLVTNSLIPSGGFFGSQQRPLYPLLQVLPGGILFVHLRNTSRLYISGGFPLPVSFTTRHSGTRTYPGQACCVPLTIDGENPTSVKLLVVGGSEELEPGDETPATNTAEIFEFDVRNPFQSRWRRTTPLPEDDGRFMSDGVLLPDGRVFVTSGARKGLADNNEGEARTSFIFEPDSETWLRVADAPRSRAYHSTAVLLPDGRVLVGGSTGPGLIHEGALFGIAEPVSDTFGGAAERHDEFKLDIFSPPYLSRGPRPTVGELPRAIGYARELTIRTPQALEITDVALMRPGSTTHTVNMDQRRVRLYITERTADQIRVTTPDDGHIAPPGFYMLFVLNYRGVPSIGKFVQLGL